MDVAILPVDLLRLKIETKVELFAPELAYDTDLSVFTGDLFDIAISGEFVDEWRIVEKLTDRLYRYADHQARDDCKSLVMSSLRVVEDHVSRYLNHRVRSWRWLDYHRNNIIILSGDDE